METFGNQKVAKSGTQNFYCQHCDYKCSKKYNWTKHLMTSKHSLELNGNQKVAKSGKKWQINENFDCETCSKSFKTKSGLWKHYNRGNCKHSQSLMQLDKDELILTLLKQNADLITNQQSILTKITEHDIINISNLYNTNNTNSHNKAFNLNFFLNETCKNAMNITDFVDSIKLQLSDLMEVGELGYVEGISKIIVKNLKNLDETVRPIHCTDKKRETMYIKDEGEWVKEDDKKTKLKRVITNIADKNIKLLPLFREKYPEYKNSSSKVSDVHDKLVIEVMETEDDKKDKIIHNISKVTIIREK